MKDCRTIWVGRHMRKILMMLNTTCMVLFKWVWPKIMWLFIVWVVETKSDWFSLFQLKKTNFLLQERERYARKLARGGCLMPYTQKLKLLLPPLLPPNMSFFLPFHLFPRTFLSLPKPNQKWCLLCYKRPIYSDFLFSHYESNPKPFVLDLIDLLCSL